VTRPAYRVEFARPAIRELARLRADEAVRLRQPIFELSFEPRPVSARPVIGTPYLRIRIGEVRVVYLVDDELLLVVIERIARRSESTYRRL
jgi:mRNA interferase RelE/StbE